MLTAITQKDVFDPKFLTKLFTMMILVSRSMFLRSSNLLVPLLLIYDLDLSKS